MFQGLWTFRDSEQAKGIRQGLAKIFWNGSVDDEGDNYELSFAKGIYLKTLTTSIEGLTDGTSHRSDRIKSFRNAVGIDDI